MTSLKFKKMSVLLGVLAIVLCTLSADPTISGEGYVQVTSKITGTNIEDITVSPAYSGEIILEDEADGASINMTNYFSLSDTDTVEYTLNNLYIRYDAAEDDFGNNYALQIGRDCLSFAGSNNYNAGDITSDNSTDWFETWNLYLEAPVVSNDTCVLMLTPFAVMDMSGTDDEGLGAIANYSFTEAKAISELELSYYYNNTSNESRIGAAIVGNLGFDFGVNGYFNLTDDTDYDFSVYMKKIFDKTALTFDLLYVNFGSVYLRPSVDFTVNESTIISAYDTLVVVMADGSSTNTAYLYATTYLTEDLYVRPYIYTDFDTYVKLRFRVSKSF